MQSVPARGALNGALVADFSRVLSGPLSSMLLADLGADVIKVERPGTGDDTRAWGPPFVDGDSTYYLAVNRNKRSVVLDLREPSDLRAATDLACRADILIENFRPGTMERLGLGYEHLSRRNPRLIYCAVSGFGRERGAALPGYDFLIQAMGGLMSITGETGGPPLKAGVAIVDVLAGLFATVGILAAVHAREASGRGQRVDVALLSSLLAALVNQAQACISTGTPPRRMGNRHPSVAPYELYRASDGQIVIAIGTDRQFRALAEVVGLDPEAVETRYASNADRVNHGDELRAAIEERLAKATSDAWLPALQAHSIPCGRVNDLAQALELAAELGLGPTVSLARGDGSEVVQVANPLQLSGTPVSYRTPPPNLGEHTDEVRSWLRSPGVAPE